MFTPRPASSHVANQEPTVLIPLPRRHSDSKRGKAARERTLNRKALRGLKYNGGK